MNIFYLDSDIELAAQYHNDRHIVKMPLETAQLLCTTLNLNGVQTPYKSTHVNHPCRLWCSTQANFKWLCQFGLSLCREYTYRRGKVHKCEAVIQFCAENASRVPHGLWSDPPQCMPDEHKCDNVIQAYRNYYKTKKWTKNGLRMDKWTKRDRPSWFDYYLLDFIPHDKCVIKQVVINDNKVIWHKPGLYGQQNEPDSYTTDCIVSSAIEAARTYNHWNITPIDWDTFRLENL